MKLNILHDLVGGRYEVISLIRKSAMSLVYLGVDTVTGQNVILKILNSDPNRLDGEHGELLTRFHLEASIYRKLDHQNIVNMLDLCKTDNGSLCMVMEFVTGPTLEALRKRIHSFTIGSRLSLLQQICSAVDFSHSRGIWHRDLKPSNIMVTPEWIVKVLDFGIAKVRGNADITTNGTLLTPEYSSPEQIACSRDLNHLSDLFVLGILAYVIITGHHPFAGETPRITMTNIDQGIRFFAPNEKELPLHLDKWHAVFKKALNPQPSLRFSSADYFFEKVLDCIQMERKRHISVEGHFRFPSFRLECLDEVDEARCIKWELFLEGLLKDL